MASQTIGHNRSFKAAADYSAKQFYLVYLSAEGIVTLASAATQFLMGPLENKPKAGEIAVVTMRHGGATGKVKAGGVISIGDYLTTDGNGKAIATTTLGNEVFGRALQAGVDGDVVEYMPHAGKYHALS